MSQPRPRTPVLLVSGIDESAMAASTISLQFGIGGAVAVRHVIDAERHALTRIVSDVTGVLEREVIDLEHACVSCAIREDIIPTLERLARAGTWSTIVACLPVTAEPVQVCRVLGWAPHQAPHVMIAAVVVALDGASVRRDLLGDELLAERGLATSAEDRRGVAEVAASMVEYADVLSLTVPPSRQDAALLASLARPGCPTVVDPSLLDATTLAAGVHDHAALEEWGADVRRGELPTLADAADGAIWRLDLRSERPVHPLRFREELAVIGGGPRRSRGCLWLPTRPDTVAVWRGAGGQASLGTGRPWGRDEERLTRIVVTGVDPREADRRAIEEAFARCLLTDDELASRGWVWHESWDGLEPWLGPIDLDGTVAGLNRPAS